ncbi:MAG: hypothetical protein ACO1SV_08735 [Fimbriimonas sp.]
MRPYHALFTLATHAAAAVAGYDVELDSKRNRFLRHIDEWAFLTPGPNGAKLAKSPDQWFAALRSTGVDRAWFGTDVEERYRFWGLITLREGRRYQWALNESTVSEDDRTWQRGWCGAELSHSDLLLPRVDIRKIAADLRGSIEALREFGDRHRREETEFLVMFDAALRLLDGLLADDPDVDVPEPLADLFPPQGIGRDARLLAAAVAEADVLGGMGSWYDWAPPDVPTKDRFVEITNAFANLTAFSLEAASFGGVVPR